MRPLANCLLISMSLFGCTTMSSSSSQAGKKLRSPQNRVACGSIIGGGKADLDFRAICIGETTAVAKTGKYERQDYNYSVKRDPNIPKIYYLEPVNKPRGNSLTLILKVNPNYKVTSLVDALLAKDVTLDGAGGRLWITGHPAPEIGGEGSYIADDFELNISN